LLDVTSVCNGKRNILGYDITSRSSNLTQDIVALGKPLDEIGFLCCNPLVQWHISNVALCVYRQYLEYGSDDRLASNNVGLDNTYLSEVVLHLHLLDVGGI
jgi:hypothetical protein